MTEASLCYYVIVTGHIALEAACILACKKEDELLTRLHPDIVNAAKHFDAAYEVSVQESVIADLPKSCIFYMKKGFLQTLWEAARSTGMGMEIDLNAVPIRQESVEICEFFFVNPYETRSGGSFLIVTPYERAVRAAFSKQGIDSRVVGVMTEKKEMLLSHNGVCSNLNRPAPDMLDKILSDSGESSL